MHSKSLLMGGVLMAVIVTAGCSTKNYGRQPNLTGFEKNTMSCREIDLEQAKVQGFIKRVGDESEFDGRSVLSFLGDFGIGNVMEKNSAMESATSRLAELDSARTSKSCDSVSSEPSKPVARTPVSSSRSVDEQISDLQQDQSISYEEYQYRYRRITGQN